MGRCEYCKINYRSQRILQNQLSIAAYIAKSIKGRSKSVQYNFMVKFLEFIFEVLGWIRIVLSPVLISLFIAVPVYYHNPNALGITIAVILVSTALIIGIKWANSTWRKPGTQQYLSRISSSQDLDAKPEKEENKTEA